MPVRRLSRERSKTRGLPVTPLEHRLSIRRVIRLVGRRRECDSRRRFTGQLRRISVEAPSGLDGQHVLAEAVDLRKQPGLRGGGQSKLFREEARRQHYIGGCSGGAESGVGIQIPNGHTYPGLNPRVISSR